MPCPKCEHCKETKLLTDQRKPDIQEVWDFAVEQGFSLVRPHIQRFAINRLLKTMSPQNIKDAVQYSQMIREQPYSPQINNFLDLEMKLPKLRDFYRRNSSSVSTIVKL